jgi:hypothetical protein
MRKRDTLTVPRFLAQDIQPQRRLTAILRGFCAEGKLILADRLLHEAVRAAPDAHASLQRPVLKLTLPPFAILDFRFMIAGLPPPGFRNLKRPDACQYSHLR